MIAINARNNVNFLRIIIFLIKSRVIFSKPRHFRLIFISHFFIIRFILFYMFISFCKRIIFESNFFLIFNIIYLFIFRDTDNGRNFFFSRQSSFVLLCILMCQVEDFNRNYKKVEIKKVLSF